MEVKCPHCNSRFNLPDALSDKAGAKLRCSVCKNVFPLVPVKKEEVAPPPVKKKKSHKLLWIVIIFLLLALGSGYGSYWYFSSKSNDTPLNEKELESKVALLTMRNVRQYYVDNEKIGKVFVIEGKIVNEFPEPKELIAVEAAIYGNDQKPLAVKKQLAGTQLSLFQLQVLSEKEMESFLNNKVEILSNNTNVQKGGEVPFMVLFYMPPEGLAEFGVRIVDVKDVGKPK